MGRVEDFSARRRVPRRAYFHKVGVLYRGRYRLGEAFEIGEKGMLFATSFEMAVGDQVVLSFYIPGYGHSLARAVVRYLRDNESVITKFKYGVEFETADFDCRRYIRYYVASDDSKEGLKSKRQAAG